MLACPKDMSRNHSLQQAFPCAATETSPEMPRPPIDADVQSIGGSHGLCRIPAVFPNQVEERAPPRIAGEETVQIGAERTPVAPADLGAGFAHKRLALLRDRVATPVADLVA